MAFSDPRHRQSSVPSFDVRAVSPGGPPFPPRWRPGGRGPQSSWSGGGPLAGPFAHALPFARAWTPIRAGVIGGAIFELLSFAGYVRPVLDGRQAARTKRSG